MKFAKLLTIGKFLPSDIEVTLSESNRKIDPKIENKVDDIWNAKLKKAENEGRICYNGTSYRLNSFRQRETKIFLDFTTIDFKTRISLLGIPEYLNLSEEYYKKGCSTDATVKTADNRYVMVELSGKSMNSNITDLMGGLVEKPLELASGEDLFKALYIELEEEGSISKSDISEIYLKAIYLSHLTDIHFYFEVSLNVSFEELNQRFKTENKDQDIKGIIDFSFEEYVIHLQNHASLNKRFVAGLL